MNTSLPGIGLDRKIAYSFIGLIAGDVAMLILFSLVTQAWEQPPSHFLGSFPFYVSCSLFGWVAIGIPAILLTNTDYVARLNWLRIVIVGILLGAAALIVIFIIFGHLPVAHFRGFLYCWIFASLAAGIASGVYSAFVARALRIEEIRSKPLDVPVPKATEGAFSLEDYLRKPEDAEKPLDFK
jgi:hypothetical protein